METTNPTIRIARRAVRSPWARWGVVASAVVSLAMAAGYAVRVMVFLRPALVAAARVETTEAADAAHAELRKQIDRQREELKHLPGRVAACLKRGLHCDE